ncbi:MAG: FUSC family protein [Pseudonocardia sp.]
MSDLLAGARAALRQRDPDLAAVRRAARVTVAGSVAFFGARFLVSDTTVALYAVFGALALGVLSDVTGSPRQRTLLMLGALPVGLALVALGTALAGNVWAAAAGMFVVGFVVAYTSVLGPRIGGVANGLHLSYILACFPPYDPASLPARLAGLTLGVLLLVVADRVLWPAPTPRGFPDRLAEAVESLQPRLDAVAAGLPPPPDPRPELRLSRVPISERPVGPGVRDRSLTIAAAALRAVSARLTGLTALPGGPLLPVIRELLAAVADALRTLPPALRGTGPPPELDPLEARLDAFLALREQMITEDPSAVAHRDLRRGTAAVMIAHAARTLVTAVRAATGAPTPRAVLRGEIAPATFAYLAISPAQRLWRRLRVHLNVHSVHFQNAARLAVGLAVARVVAELPVVSHGFWVLLATLTLMRTSMVTSRAALRPAFVGVLVGAIAAGVLVTVIGVHTDVYGWTLPLIMLAGLAAGPLLGPAAGQAGFTVLITVLFAQLAPATWRLAETRLVDVVLGGLIGALIGAAVWPRGGAGELRRTAADVLRSGAHDLVRTVTRLVGRPEPDGPSQTARLLVLLDATHAQYRTEAHPGSGSKVDWLTVLGTAHRLADESDLLLGRCPQPGPVPWPAVSATLEATARDRSRDLHAVADALEAVTTPGPGVSAPPTEHPPPAPYWQDPQDALRVIDAWGWLYVLAGDVDRLRGAVDPEPDPDDPAGRLFGRVGRT